MEPAYRYHVSRESTDLPRWLPRWRAFNEASGERSIPRDPDWLLDRYKEGVSGVGKREDLIVVFLLRGEQVVGVCPLLVVPWPVSCTFGEIALARFPFRRACLHWDLQLPADDAALDCLFAALESIPQAFDGLYVEEMVHDSRLWRYVHESPRVAQAWRRFIPRAPTRHSIVRMPETFTEYLAKYSSKTRRKLKRAVRLLAREGRVEVIRVTAAEEVDAFVDAAERVSRTSYQYNLLGLGIQDPQREKRQLGFWARQGWLRSYLLKIDDRPVAYMFGLQDARTFYYWDVAHDPEWNRLSPGKVLQYHVFEDVFAHRRPEVFDFSTGHGEHKQFFENDCFFGADVFLVPRRVYPSLVLHAHLATRRATDKVSELLDRFNLKHRVRRAIRQASVVLRGRRQ